ncbi:MAG TPA: metallophosphoesterase [bacterium]|nr:metallophosphoesterase [bacterium]
MKISRNRVSLNVICFAALLVIFSASAGQCSAVRKINQIKEPLFSCPAIVLSGSGFDLKLETDSLPVKSIFLVDIKNNSNAFPLELKNPSDSKGIRSYKAIVSSDVPEGLYNLAAEFDNGVTDNQPHSVRVIKKYKKQYHFIHLTDIHFNAGKVMPEKRNAIRQQLLRDIEESKPEFVLFSGDLGLYPKDYDRDYEDSYRRFKQELSVPIFMVPGNHEFYIDKTETSDIDGKSYWDVSYGPAYNSFDYDGMHYMGLNTFDWPARWRDRYNEEVKRAGTTGLAYIGPEQWEWMKSDMAKAAGSDKTIVIYTHIPVELLQGGRRIGTVNQEKMPGPTYNKVLKIFEKAGVSHVFVGHVHINSVRKLGNTTEMLTLGAGHTNRDSDPRWGYRIIRVFNNKITGTETHEITYTDLD